jgi:hypothetical protein
MIGMDPCGVVFGFLRSCYTTKARLVHGSGRQSTVRWYFAPSGASYFTKRHCMEPLAWSGGSGAGNTQGEVIGAPRPYNKGATPTCAVGSTVWGEDSWFNDGVPSLSGPWIANECGLPVSCPSPPCPAFFPAGIAHTACAMAHPFVFGWFRNITTTSQVRFQADFHSDTHQISVFPDSTATCGTFARQQVFGASFGGAIFPRPGFLNFIDYNPSTHVSRWGPGTTGAETDLVVSITFPPT